MSWQHPGQRPVPVARGGTPGPGKERNNMSATAPGGCGKLWEAAESCRRLQKTVFRGVLRSSPWGLPPLDTPQ
eukprot:4644256-Alexandrium_andersonii.AAC.1